MKFDPALIKPHAETRAAIHAAKSTHEPRTCACDDCVDQRWNDARDDEFDARWNARMEA